MTNSALPHSAFLQLQGMTPKEIGSMADLSLKFMEFMKREAAREALIKAADDMPIETLHGADGASVWLRDYADSNYPGKK